MFCYFIIVSIRREEESFVATKWQCSFAQRYIYFFVFCSGCKPRYLNETVASNGGPWKRSWIPSTIETCSYDEARGSGVGSPNASSQSILCTRLSLYPSRCLISAPTTSNKQWPRVSLHFFRNLWNLAISQSIHMLF